jgi:tetratricopeptide (TPR) repeat protein
MDGDPGRARQYYLEYLDRQAAYDEHAETDHVILLHLRSRHNAYYGLGLAAEMTGDFREAATWFERCTAERDDYLDVHHRLAVAYLNTGRHDDALREFARELELKPDNTEARIALADQYVQLGNTEEAHASLLEGHTADPQHGALAFQLAALEFGMQRWQDALTHLAFVPGDHQLSLNACRLRAEILFQTGGYAESAELYERCRKSNPGDAEVLNNLGNCRFKIGDYEGAEKLYQQVIDAGHANPQVYRNLGISLARQNKIDDAIFTLESYADLNPEDVESFGFLGDLHYGRADYGRAIDEYEKVLEVQPSRPDTLVRLGDCYLQRGAVSAALLGYERALNADPDYKPAWARVREVREYLVTRINERGRQGQ